jgi:hypothetical protein
VSVRVRFRTQIGILVIRLEGVLVLREEVVTVQTKQIHNTELLLVAITGVGERTWRYALDVRVKNKIRPLKLSNILNNIPCVSLPHVMVMYRPSQMTVGGEL